MRVAVTGGAGFIGQAVIEQLPRWGHEPLSLDMPVHDVRCPGSLEAITHADAVIHLAGVLGTSELWDSAPEAIDVNVKGTLHVLNACRAGGTAYVGITMPDCWPNVYQATKQCAQRLAVGFRRDFDVPVTHIRAFNAYGAGQKHGPGHPQKIVPTFATHAYAGEPMPVWGDGRQTVDLVHVDHIAACLVHAATTPDSSFYGDGQVWDAGSGIESRVIDVAYRVAHTAGATPALQHLPMRPGEIPDTRLCATVPGPLGFDRSLRLDEVVRTYAPLRARS